MYTIKLATLLSEPLGVQGLGLVSPLRTRKFVQSYGNCKQIFFPCLFDHRHPSLWSLWGKVVGVPGEPPRLHGKLKRAKIFKNFQAYRCDRDLTFRQRYRIAFELPLDGIVGSSQAVMKRRDEA